MKGAFENLVMALIIVSVIVVCIAIALFAGVR